MTKEQFESWFLDRPLFQKLNIMRDALLDTQLGPFMQLVDIVLEAPISQGGVATEDLQQAFGSDLSNPNHFTGGKRFGESDQGLVTIDTD